MARPKLSKNVIDLDKKPEKIEVVDKITPVFEDLATSGEDGEKVDLNKYNVQELGFAAPYFNDDMTIKDELGLSLYLKWHSLPKGYSIVDRKAVRG